MVNSIEQQLIAIEAEYKEELRTCNELVQKYTPQQIQKLGLGLIHLKVSGTRTGLGGKCLVQLEVDQNGTPSPLPAHKLKIGDIVLVQPDSGPLTQKDPSTQATLFRITENQVTLVLPDVFPDFLTSRCRIIRLSNETSYQRMKKVLQDLQKDTTPSTFTQILLHKTTPSLISPTQKLSFFNTKLNESQKSAVQFCLAVKEIGLIHGPPGTGKTESLVELIQHLVKRGDRVLVCGPSNLSVDNIVERLSKTRCKHLVRLGHPARILESIVHYNLDLQLKSSDQGQLIKDIIEEMDECFMKLRKTKNKSERQGLYQEVKALRKDLKIREKKILSEYLFKVPIVVSTLNGVATKKLMNLTFDTVIIDEAAQALEPDCWIALRKASRVIFAGDHCQLPPTLMVSDSCLSMTLFEKLVQWYPTHVQVLTVQYRMHQDIMTFSNQFFYSNQLCAHPSVAQQTLFDLTNQATFPPLILMDTVGLDYFETDVEGSKCNSYEVDLVVNHVQLLLQSEIKATQIVVLTPYHAQVQLIREAFQKFNLMALIEVGTVDGMQGRENEVVILSLVRSNENREIGFLSEARRLNVAVTRAKRHLCVICDSDTVSLSPFCKGLIDYITEKGELRYPGYD